MRLILVTVILLRSAASRASKANYEFTFLVHSIVAQYPVETFLIYGDLQLWAPEVIELGQNVGEPKLLMTAGNTVNIRDNFNRLALAVVLMSASAQNVAFLEPLPYSLQYMRATRILVMFKGTADGQLHEREAVFKFFMASEMLNVLAIYEDDFRQRGSYYAYTKYPSFQIELCQYRRPMVEPLYPNRLRNLYGHVLHSLPDGYEPRTIIRRGGNVSGYLWDVVKVYASYLNASLELPPNVTLKRYDNFEMREFTQNFTIDICACLISPSYYFALHENSYPVTYGDWCLMLPQEPAVEAKHILRLLFTGPLTVALIVLLITYSFLVAVCDRLLDQRNQQRSLVRLFFNRNCLLGILGRTFVMPSAVHRILSTRIIFACVIFTGLFFNNLFSAMLQSLLTEPPLQKEVRNMTDLRAAGLKILLHHNEFNVLPKELKHKYRDCFEVTDNYNSLSFFNISSTEYSYAYITTNERWGIQEIVQRYSRKKWYRFSNICFARSTYSRFIMSPNSVHRVSFDNYLGRIASAGLLNYWQTLSYGYMVKAGRVTIAPSSKPKEYGQTALMDLYWLLCIYLGGMILGLVCFVSEVVWFKYCLKGNPKK